MYGGSGLDDGENKPAQIHSNVLNLFLQSVGIVLTDIQDVVFKYDTLCFPRHEHVIPYILTYKLNVKPQFKC